MTKASCNILPELPGTGRDEHTSVNGVICGGDKYRTSCIDVTSGSWSSSTYDSIRERYYHLSWNTDPGKSFMLLGGLDSTHRTTSDIVHSNGTVEAGFNLLYATMYVFFDT